MGTTRVTREVQSLAFRKEAVGGVRSISCALARPLAELDGIVPLSKVYVHDGRSAVTIAEGRLSDTGRTAGADGQSWDCVAFGPLQHASDLEGPKVFIDRDLSEGWAVVDVVEPSASVGTGTLPADTLPGVLANFPAGTSLVNLSRVTYRYDRLWQTGDRLANFTGSVVHGLNSASWKANVDVGASGALTVNLSGVSATVATQSLTANALSSFYDTVALRQIWVGAGAVAADDTWALFFNLAIETLRHTKAGVAITVGYTGSTTTAAIVEELLGGGRLPQFEGAEARVSASTGVVDQLAYHDGVTPAQVLEDLMALDPAYRWYAGPDVNGLGYSFTWELWPTAVRYEATLEDGGNFPLSTQDVYNVVWVRYAEVDGITRYVTRTMACKILDDAGLTRWKTIELGSNAGTYAQAVRVGDAFLAEHNVPKNSGTLTVARPIRDIISGRPVQPWEIEPGELVRIKGVEAYPDAFNANANDGQGVFRIFSVDYTSEGNSATLALDSDPREVEDVLVALINQQSRPSKRSKR